jgi:hypothetical protein
MLTAKAYSGQEASNMKTRKVPQKARRKVGPGKARRKVGPGKARRKVFVELGSATHPPPTHTIGELAEALKKSRQTIARAIESKQINVLPLVGEHQRVSHREFLRLTSGEPLPD